MTAAAALLAVLLSAGCTGFEVPAARDDHRRPRIVRGATRPPTPEIRIEVETTATPALRYDERQPARLLSMLQRKVLAHLAAAVKQRGGLELRNDEAANALAQDLCRTQPEGALPRELYEFATRAHGIIEPFPRILSWEIPDGHDALLDTRVTAGIDRMLGREGFRRVGIASCSSPRIHGRRLLVTLLKGLVRIAPLARRLQLGQRAVLQAQLAEPRSEVALMVAAPDGTVSTLPTRQHAESVSGALRCSGPGVYQLELVGTGPYGPEVLTNFPLYCDRTPPERATVRYRPRTLGPTPQIEAALLAETNAFRQLRGLPALLPSAALAEVARRHSLDMRDSGFFGHLSPSSGGPADRLASGRVAHTVVRENIATAYRVADVIPALAASPGHRQALQANDVTQIGIGVVVDRTIDPPLLYVTQNLIRPRPTGRGTGAQPHRATAGPGSRTRYTDLAHDCRPIAGQRQHLASALTCPGPGGYGLRIDRSGQRLTLQLLHGNEVLFSLPPQGVDLLRRKVEWRLADGRPYALIVRIYDYGDDDTDPAFGRRLDHSSTVQLRGLGAHAALNARIRVRDGDSDGACRAARALADRALRQQDRRHLRFRPERKDEGPGGTTVV